MDASRLVAHASVLLLYLSAAVVPCPRAPEVVDAGARSGSRADAPRDPTAERQDAREGRRDHAHAHAPGAPVTDAPGRPRDRHAAHGRSSGAPSPHAGHGAHPHAAPDAPARGAAPPAAEVSGAGDGRSSELAWNARCPCGCDERDPTAARGGPAPLLVAARLEPDGLPSAPHSFPVPAARMTTWRGALDPVPI